MKTKRMLSVVCIAGFGLLLSQRTVSPQGPGSGASAPSLASRLQRLEDIEEIRKVLLDYGRFLDSRDLTSYSRLFAKDGEWVGGFGSAKSPAGIQAFMEKNLGTGPNRGITLHIMSNFEITVTGDTATAWSRWTFVTPGPDGRPVISQAGRYDDTLVRENGRWKFKRREAFNDIPAPK
jgi:ketosteroid isomerase-like protein